MPRMVRVAVVISAILWKTVRIISCLSFAIQVPQRRAGKSVPPVTWTIFHIVWLRDKRIKANFGKFGNKKVAKSFERTKKQGFGPFCGCFGGKSWPETT